MRKFVLMLFAAVVPLCHAESVPLLLRQPTVSKTEIVFTYGGEADLSDDDRDMFWEAFGVPVFEQYLGRGNELLAVECDAHTGLHLVGDFENLNRGRKGCACGSPNPRLPRRPRIAELAELLAAVGAPAVGGR